MDTYTYAYKTDSKHEVIGRVKATGLYEAREQIAEIKQLSFAAIEELFVIKKEDDHGNKVRKN
jgi:hypothetical protein